MSELGQWEKSGDLTIASGMGDILELREQHNLSKSLSIADLSVWALTKHEGGVLLTSDGTLRKMAQKHRIETHGLLWVFDQLVEYSLLSAHKASKQLHLVFNQNTHYKSDQKLFEAFERLLERWENR